MKRRDFIAGLGGAAVVAPRGAWGQQTIPVIGFLHSGSAAGYPVLLAAFRKGLSEEGFFEGQNVLIEYAWGESDNDRLPLLAAQLVRRGVSVLVTPGSTPAALAAKAVTTTIPIVFTTAADPVEIGLVVSLAKPGGNITGVSDIGVELGAKRLGILHELLPKAARFGVLINPNNPSLARPYVEETRNAASALGWALHVVHASSNMGIDDAYEKLLGQQVDALLVSPDALFVTRRVQLITLAARHSLPAMYFRREFVEAGGLMSYGSNLADQFRQNGIYAGRILKGEKPAAMPVHLPTKFEFIINLQTAKTLSIAIPNGLLARADEVIE